MVESDMLKLAKRQIITDCVKPLSTLGFKVKNSTASRNFEEVLQLIEFVFSPKRSDGCLYFQMFATVYADGIMEALSSDYPPNGVPFPLFMLEARELSAQVTSEVLEPLRVCSTGDIDLVIKRANELCKTYLVPFLNECQDLNGIRRQLSLGRAYLGGQAKSEAFLRILNEGKDKWRWSDSFERNLERVGLVPQHFKNGRRIVS